MSNPLPDPRVLQHSLDQLEIVLKALVKDMRANGSNSKAIRGVVNDMLETAIFENLLRRVEKV